MTKQAVIYFKSGKKDWVDPIDENSVVYKNDMVFIDNGYFVYDYLMELIEKIEIIDI